MEEVYANVEFDKPDDARASTCQTGQKKFSQVAVLFLGLLSFLLLVVIIGFSVYCHSSEHKVSALEEKLQTCGAQLSSMTEQKNQLNVSLAGVTKKLQCLITEKTCPPEWTKFACSCYLIPKLKNSWPLSRKNCRDRGADLVVINSLEEQKFVTNATKNSAWIGLSDVDNEGTWKWTDGTPLTLSLWAKNQPDNGRGDPKYGEEDCAYIIKATKSLENWNDISCHYSLTYICEK